MDPVIEISFRTRLVTSPLESNFPCMTINQPDGLSVVLGTRVNHIDMHIGALNFTFLLLLQVTQLPNHILRYSSSESLHNVSLLSI